MALALRACCARAGSLAVNLSQAAINEAQQGLAEGGIPIGSVIVHRGVWL
jgi:hypothetical protein